LTPCLQLSPNPMYPYPSLTRLSRLIRGGWHPVKDRTVTPRCLGMWRLDSVVKCGRTVQEMVVVIKIYIYLFTRGYKPQHRAHKINKQKHSDSTHRNSSAWHAGHLLGRLGPNTGTCSRPKPGPRLGPDTKPEAKYIASHRHKILTYTKHKTRHTEQGNRDKA